MFRVGRLTLGMRDGRDLALLAAIRAAVKRASDRQEEWKP